MAHPFGSAKVARRFQAAIFSHWDSCSNIPKTLIDPVANLFLIHLSTPNLNGRDREV